MTEAHVSLDVPQDAEVAAPLCADCRAALAADQRYCINCGLRCAPAGRPFSELRAPRAAASAAAAGRELPAGAAPRTLTPLGAAIGLGLILLSVLLGAVIGSSDPDRGQATVLTVPSSAAATAPAAFTSDWSGGDGWTVALQGLPKATTTATQVAAAVRDATTAGLGGTGALDSDGFASLEAGQYVVYAGRFSSRRAAQKQLSVARAKYADARVLEVRREAGDKTSADSSGSSGDDAATVTPSEKLTPDEYVKKSKKLPDELSTGGQTLKQDDAAPGGGSGDAEVIK